MDQPVIGVAGSEDRDRMAEFIESSVSPKIVSDVLAVFEKMDEYHPDEEVWYLPLIVVDPAHLGERRHGFETIGQIQVGNSPLVTPIYRAAR